MASGRRCPVLTIAFVIIMWIPANICTQSPYSAHYSVMEGIREPTVIGDVVSDSGLNEKYDSNIIRSFRFAVLKSDHNELFSVDRARGLLRANKTVDRDALCPWKPSCTIHLDIGVVQPIEYFLVIQITVDILDLNDNSPVFPQDLYSLQISENTNVGVQFVLPVAQDLDSGTNAVQGYRLESNSSTFALKVNAERAGMVDLELLLVEALDSESVSHYRMQVVAIDGGDPPRSGSMDIDIRVVDANDNPPVFSQTLYNVTVPEDIPIGYILVRVKAVDADKGMNGQVLYDMIDHPLCIEGSRRQNSFAAQNEQCQFTMNTNTGEISLKKPLDFEQKVSHLLLVRATDQGPNAVPAFAKVTINVLDVNDMAPSITINALSSDNNVGQDNSTQDSSGDNAPSNAVGVEENQRPGSFVAYVSVDDNDGGASGQVACHIDDDENFGIRMLYENEYKIFTRMEFDRETLPRYGVSVICHDQGTPSLTSTYPIIVNVLDQNDNSPIFSRELYKAEVKENNAINDSLFSVSATDLDIGLNGEVSYHVHSTYRPLFSIDEHTGIVRPKIVFDRESMTRVDAEIIAVDKGTPPRTATTRIRVKIMDDNDNAPHFNKLEYNFGTFENQPHGTEIGTLEATDIDTEPYAVFTFSMENRDLEGVYMPFTIDRHTGRITSTKMLDREDISVYHLVATVRDTGNSSLFSRANVTIYVEDKNDNPPVITYPSSVKDKVILHDMPQNGAVVTQVRAVDLDLGENARILFSIMHGNDWGLWEIGQESGQLVYIGDNTYIPSVEHLLVIAAKDGGIPQLSTTAQLTIIFNITLPNEDLNQFNLNNADPNAQQGQYGGIGPELQFRIILVLAIITTFIVLILVTIIIILRRRQIHQKKRKKTQLPNHCKLVDQDQTYLFINNNQGATGSGFVKGVCDPEPGHDQEHPGDGTSLLDIDLSSSGISMGSEAAGERAPTQQYHLSHPELKQRYESDWLHSIHRSRGPHHDTLPEEDEDGESSSHHNNTNESMSSGLPPPRDSPIPLTIRNISMDGSEPTLSDNQDAFNTVIRSKNHQVLPPPRGCDAGVPKLAHISQNQSKNSSFPSLEQSPVSSPSELLEMTPDGTIRSLTPLATSREKPMSFKTFQPGVRASSPKSSSPGSCHSQSPVELDKLRYNSLDSSRKTPQSHGARDNLKYHNRLARRPDITLGYTPETTL